MSSLYLLNPLNLPNLLTPTRVQLELQFVIFSSIFIGTLIYSFVTFDVMNNFDLFFVGLGVFLILVFLYLVLRERDSIDEAMVDAQFEKDFNKKLKAEADIAQYNDEKDLLKLGGGVDGDLRNDPQIKKGAFREARDIDKKIEKAKKDLFSADSNLKAYSDDYKNENAEVIKGLNRFKLDSTLNRELNDINQKMKDINSRPVLYRDTEANKILLKNLQKRQRQIIKKQGEVAKLTGDENLIEQYNLDRSNVKLRKDHIRLLREKGAATSEELKKKNDEDEKTRDKINSELDKAKVNLREKIKEADEKFTKKATKDALIKGLEKEQERLRATLKDFSKTNRDTVLSDINTVGDKLITERAEQRVLEQEQEKVREKVREEESRVEGLKAERDELNDRIIKFGNFGKNNKNEDDLTSYLLDPKKNEEISSVDVGDNKVRYYRVKNNPRVSNLMKDVAETSSFIKSDGDRRKEKREKMKKK